MYTNLSTNLYTMLKQQVISVTDLRKNTKMCFKDLDKNPKFIFLNNKIVGVLLDVDQYEALIDPELAKSIEDSWAEYKAGKSISHEELVKQYGLSD